MATGIATSQGWSPQMVVGMDHVPEQNNQFLFNQMSLISTTGNIAGENQTKFGGTKRLKKINSDIFYLKKSLKK